MEIGLPVPKKKIFEGFLPYMGVEAKVKGTGSRFLLKECVKDNNYARFHLHSYHCCREMNFISRLDVNFLDSTQNIDKVSGA